MKKIIVSVLLCLSFLCGCGEESSTAFTVNDVAVSKKELIFYMNRLLDVTISDVETKYEIDSTKEDFWNTPVGNTTPLEILKEAAVKKITRQKVEMICARDNGIKTLPFDYSKQIRSWEKDNDERQWKDANGEVVYGNVLRTFHTYFQDEFLSMQSELKIALEQKGKIKISPKEMKELYEKYKTELEGSFEESENTVHGWLLNEKYEKYIDSLVSSAKVDYKDMNVEADELT